MCEDCWQSSGAPTIDTPAVREAALLAERVYAFSCVGAHLHVVLDDWNLAKDHIKFCLAQIRKARAGKDRRPNDIKNLAENLDVQERCAVLLLAMPIKERASALALWHRWWQ